MKKENRLPFNRRLIQLYAALLYNAHVRGFIEGDIYTGNGKMLCVPGLNCYSCPGAAGACPLGALQNALAAAGNRAPYYALGILLLFGVTLGRTVCGWLCPAGLLQELLHRIPGPKLRKSRATRALSHLKYVILAVFVVGIPLWNGLKQVPLPAFCKYICPAGTLGGAVALLAHPANADKFSMLGLLFTQKWVILILSMLACVFVYRAFCRFLCPLGAIYGLFNRFCLAGIRVKEDRCVRRGKCVACCPMDVRKLGDRECIACGKCVGACPKDAITLQAGRFVLMGTADPKSRSRAVTRRGRIVLSALLALLLGAALVFANLPAKPGASVPVGCRAGERLADFVIETMDGGVFRLSDCRGKIVVVNLWATWCGPCVNELPCFEALAQAHDDVAVLAIHSDLITDDVAGYLANYDYSFPFAIDETGGVIAALGGSTMLPQTIVISAEGVVTYNQVGSVTTDKLEALVSEAKADQPTE
ncbi:MAG: redoxin family protein [Clostridia bacterium]|nr:redoxin family protein [Clostridia bacterium]